VHLFPATVCAIFRLNKRLVEEVGEVVGMLIGSEDNVATPPAVTAIRSTFGNKFLTSKADTPAPTFSSLGKDFDTIDKHVANCHPACLLSSAFTQCVMDYP
jgi:hypothetical protein